MREIKLIIKNTIDKISKIYTELKVICVLLNIIYLIIRILLLFL